jgi:hypothetical protein
VIGPAAFDGPALATVTVALPVDPGVIAGVTEETERSAEAAKVGTVGVEPLFPGVGSAVGDEALSAPPVPSVDDGVALAKTFNGTSTATDAPGAIGPATLQTMGPAGIGPVQPAGSAVISTPVGGV